MTQQYSYDGFGNLTGTLGAIVWSFDPSRNAPAGSVDANGDSATAGLQWNVENRLVGQSQYPSSTTIGYEPWGKRVWEQTWDANNGPGNPSVTVYSITGRQLRQFTVVTDGQGNVTLTTTGGVTCPCNSIVGENVYFGGKLIRSQGVTVATDRLGSVRGNANGEQMAYLPYGQERGTPTTPDNREKFGTYWRDQTLGADYADQRYYGFGTGMFLSPDPGGIRTADPTNPVSWNRYAYANADPVNFVDPHGLFAQNPCADDYTQIGCDPTAYLPTNGGDSGIDLGGGGGGGGTAQIPCGPDNPNLTQVQQNLLGSLSFGSLNTVQQLVFLTVTADAAQLGVNLSGYELSSASDIWIAGDGHTQTELNLTSTSAEAFGSLQTSLTGDFSGAGWDPFHTGGFGKGGNWRQSVPTNSMQITPTPGGGGVQIDIDPHNPNIFGGSDLLGVIGHGIDVLRNTLSGKDTNYSNVAAALNLNLYNCNH